MFSSNDTFLIADCHLDGSRPGLSNLFIQFLDAIEGAGELWILGDFVEYWLGDDAGNPALSPAFEALAARQAAGTNVHLMHGNRDFLISQHFGDQIGATVHTNDEKLIQLGNETVLLMHGDTLCTGDTEYQKLRSLVRSEAWQKHVLSLSIQERIEKAKSMREQSQVATADKAHGIMDVNEEVVRDTFKRTGARTLIHGHTHRPNTHQHELGGPDDGHNNAHSDGHRDGFTGERIVVGDWHDDHAMVAHYAGTRTDASIDTGAAISTGANVSVMLRNFPF